MSIIRADNFGPSAGGTTRSLRGIAAAWANLNGTGTIALRDSQNVSSVVDNGVGDYTFNTTNSFAAVDYAVSAGMRNNGAALIDIPAFDFNTVSSFRHVCQTPALAATDANAAMPTVFGDLA
jgi:hypothetical protein